MDFIQEDAGTNPNCHVISNVLLYPSVRFERFPQILLGKFKYFLHISLYRCVYNARKTQTPYKHKTDGQAI